MIIQAGLEGPSVANMIELARLNSKRRINIELLDAAGEPVDIDASTSAAGDAQGELDLEVTDLGGNIYFAQSYWPKSDAPSAPDRIVRQAAGKYHISWGDEASETDVAQRLLFNWHSRQDEDTEDVYQTQVVEIVSPRVLSLLPTLRMMIDKTVKPNLPEQYCFTGYTDGQLITALHLGLAASSEAQPYPTWSTLDAFPIETYSNILIKSAMYQGLTSQLLFAIDTDVPQYSDSGQSFVLQHAQPLAAYLSRLKQELDSSIKSFKLHFVDSGTMSAEIRLDYAFSMLLATAPTGSLFRNLWAGGSSGGV